MPVWHTSAVTYGCPCGRSHDWDRLGVIWTSCLLHLQLWESWTAARWRVLRFHTKLQSRHAVGIYPSLYILLTESFCLFVVVVFFKETKTYLTSRSGTSCAVITAKGSNGVGGRSGKWPSFLTSASSDLRRQQVENGAFQNTVTDQTC